MKFPKILGGFSQSSESRNFYYLILHFLEARIFVTVDGYCYEFSSKYSKVLQLYNSCIIFMYVDKG